MTIDHVITIPHPILLGAIYMVSEITLVVTRHSKTSSRASQDRYSLGLLWLVIFTGVFASLWTVSLVPAAKLPHPRAFCLAGSIVFVIGIILRWWAIIVLGKFFTVDVAISEQHRLIEAGPYRFVRHPSYTGALMAFFGFGLCLGNWVSVLCLMVPITVAFLWRIRIEERALVGALGDEYQSYRQRTKALIPFVL